MCVKNTGYQYAQEKIQIYASGVSANGRSLPKRNPVIGQCPMPILIFLGVVRFLAPMSHGETHTHTSPLSDPRPRRGTQNVLRASASFPQEHSTYSLKRAPRDPGRLSRPFPLTANGLACSRVSAPFCVSRICIKIGRREVFVGSEAQGVAQDAGSHPRCLVCVRTRGSKPGLVYCMPQRKVVARNAKGRITHAKPKPPLFSFLPSCEQLQ